MRLRSGCVLILWLESGPVVFSGRVCVCVVPPPIPSQILWNMGHSIIYYARAVGICWHACCAWFRSWPEWACRATCACGRTSGRRAKRVFVAIVTRSIMRNWGRLYNRLSPEYGWHYTVGLRVIYKQVAFYCKTRLPYIVPVSWFLNILARPLPPSHIMCLMCPLNASAVGIIIWRLLCKAPNLVITQGVNPTITFIWHAERSCDIVRMAVVKTNQPFFHGQFI